MSQRLLFQALVSFSYDSDGIYLTPVLPLITLVMLLHIYFSYRPQLGYKKLLLSTPVHGSFYVSNYPSSSSESLSMFHYWLSVSVHLHSSTSPENCSFYLICVKTESSSVLGAKNQLETYIREHEHFLTALLRMSWVLIK